MYETWLSLSDPPPFWTGPRVAFFVAGFAVVVAIAVIVGLRDRARIMKAHKTPEESRTTDQDRVVAYQVDPGDGLIVAGGTALAIGAVVLAVTCLGAWMAHWEHERNVFNDKLVDYAQDTEVVVALTPVKLVGPCNDLFSLVECDTLTFVGATPTGDLLDVSVTWLPTHTRPVRPGTDLPTNLDYLTVTTTPHAEP